MAPIYTSLIHLKFLSENSNHSQPSFLLQQRFSILKQSIGFAVYPFTSPACYKQNKKNKYSTDPYVSYLQDFFVVISFT